MKYIFFALLILMAMELTAGEFEYKLIETKSEKEITLLEMAEQALQYDVIFFGELHGDALLHKLEIELLQEMHRIYPELIVSMEMFERDVQPIVDSYLADEISEEEFILASRAWPNYIPDYKPIVDFVKEQGLTLVAANIPRRYAALINKQGIAALDSLSAAEQQFIARRRFIWEDEYRERFEATMRQNMANMPDNPMGMKMDIDALYAAQCLKDDTMAESILQYQRIPPRRKVLHFNGDFHSRAHLGTAQKLQYMEPMLKIAVITPVVVQTELNYTREDLQEGRFLILMRKNEKNSGE